MITYGNPNYKLGGVMFGDRIFNIEGNMIFEDKRNGLKAVIFFSQKKVDRYIGKLYKYNPALNL